MPRSKNVAVAALAEVLDDDDRVRDHIRERYRGAVVGS